MSVLTHVVGAGLAGLACALRLTQAGARVHVHEAASHAGGRCRSFDDPVVGRRIDNGNHLLLSGNVRTLAYLRDVGAARTLAGPEQATYPFFDLGSGERWTLKPNAGPIPWWIFQPSRRIPGTRAGDYLKAVKLGWARDGDTVASCLGTGRPIFPRFWQPLAVAVLNASAEEGAARLLWPVIRETFANGEAACRPLIAADGLSASFVDPAVAFLEKSGCRFDFNERLRSMSFEGARVTGLDFGDGRVSVGADEPVVLAVPPAVASDLVPGLSVPRESRAIVNAHFRLAAPQAAPSLLGLVGAVSQWLFVRRDVASVTVSAADGLIDTPAEDLAARLWVEVARALALGQQPLPPHRIVKEKRATFAQIPAELSRRPGTRTAWRNLLLAGDWTATGLPATIEGAVRSGETAAETVLRG
ncbi:MAG: FAD-binding protein [Rhodospirillales bacterium]|nr:FAD-binding protein [Rhodospirillales bacterium]